MASDVITLPDGRRLSWHEFGDLGGSPVLYTAGTPVSGLAGASYDELASQERAGPQRGPAHGDERTLGSPARREQALRREMATTPEAKHAGLRIEFEAVADALRPGTRGAVQEVAMTKRPWPFPLSEIKLPVHLWHGALDTNSPIANSRHLARELPDATLPVIDSSDHDVGHDRSDEIATVIASYMTR